MGKEFKRDTQLIIFSVIVLSLVTMSVSYSAFFSVQSLSTIQEIDTGNLEIDVLIDNTNANESGKAIFPTTFDKITDEVDGNYSLITLVNEGNIEGDFSISISYDFDKIRSIDEFKDLTNDELISHMVSLQYLKIAIYDDVLGTWIDFDKSEGEIISPSISLLTPAYDDIYSYPVLRDKILVNTTGNELYTRRYKLYVWLEEETPVSEIGKYIFLKLNVKCAAGNETITETVESIG